MNVQNSTISSQMFLFFDEMKWFWHNSKLFTNTNLQFSEALISLSLISSCIKNKVKKSELFRSWHSSIQGHSSARGGAILQRGEITKVLASKQKFKSSGSESAQFSLFFKFKQFKLPLREKDIYERYWNTWRNVIFIFVLMHSAEKS